MGFIDNSTIVVDSILTKRGKELFLSGGNTKIVKYALSDEDVDYTLWDKKHPDGPGAYGTVIENMNVLEANIARDELKTFLNSQPPIVEPTIFNIEVDALSYDLNATDEITIQPSTVGLKTLEEYLFKIGNTNVVKFYEPAIIAEGKNGQFIGGHDAVSINSSNPKLSKNLADNLTEISQPASFILTGVSTKIIQIGDIIRVFDNPSSDNDGDYRIMEILPSEKTFNYIVDRPFKNTKFSNNLHYTIMRISSTQKVFSGKIAHLAAQSINPGSETDVGITGLESGTSISVKIRVKTDEKSIKDASESEFMKF